MGISNIPSTITRNSIPGSISDIAGTITNNGGFPILSPTFAFPGITYTQSGNLTYFDSTGTLQTAANNTMVLDYDPSTLALRGYPFWQASTNLLLRSSDQTTTWAGFQTTVGADAAVAPDGTTTADKAICGNNGSSVYTRTQTLVLADSSAYAFSVFLKAGEVTSGVSLNFRDKAGGVQTGKSLNLSTGVLTGSDTGGTTSVQAINNGWYRLTFVLTSSSTGATTPEVRVVFTGTGNGTNGYYIWGATCELGSFPTPYIPTISAAVTRNIPADSITGSNLTSFYNAPFTQVVQFMLGTVVAGTYPIVSYDDGTANNQIRLYASGASLKLTVTTGGATQANITIGAVAALTAYKVAFRVSASGCGASLNGAAVQTGSGTVPTITTARIGLDQAGNAENGWIKSDLFYPTGLPDTSLPGLST